MRVAINTASPVRYPAPRLALVGAVLGGRWQVVLAGFVDRAFASVFQFYSGNWLAVEPDPVLRFAWFAGGAVGLLSKQLDHRLHIGSQ
ncbi:MAG: hypothetical protein IPN81_08960 [Nitrosomonadales bacterium]|nr:hypothetical protein [Nitrosomonadales bacterium]